MGIEQISIFLENKQGRLLAVTECLERHKINIRALSVADTADFGILRMVVNNTEEAFNILKENGFMVSINEVAVIEVADVPGGFNHILKYLAEAGVNVEYTYNFGKGAGDNVLIVFRVNNAAAAETALEEAGVKMVTAI
jgi:hypothetical protein